MASDAAIENLRAAAEGARVATGHAALADAAAQLAGAMRGIGVDCWPGFLNDAALRADARIAAARPIVLARAATSMTATDANLTRSGPYIAENPRQWIGRPPVGDGACVALARAASDAAPSQFWRQGDKVQGDPGIQAGTIIATFDRNGHHTGHAAIYLGQDRKGIQVIDQRNCQDEIENMPGQNPPGKRTIRFGETRASLVDRGESYYVIE